MNEANLYSRCMTQYQESHGVSAKVEAKYIHLTKKENRKKEGPE